MVVVIDRKSTGEFGTTPWPRPRLAELVDRINALGASHLAVSIILDRPREPRGDAILARALERFSGRLTLVASTEVDPVSGKEIPLLPLEQFRTGAVIAHDSIFWVGNVARAVPWGRSIDGHSYIAIAAELANQSSYPGGGLLSHWSWFDYATKTIFIDYTVDPATIPVISASDILAKRIPRATLSGKRVLLGYADVDIRFLEAPHYGKISYPHVQALAAETMWARWPSVIPWPYFFVPTLLIAILAHFARNTILSIGTWCGATIFMAALPFLVFRERIYVETFSSLLFLLLIGLGTIISFVRRRPPPRQPEGSDLR